MSTIVNTVASSPFENLVTSQVDPVTGNVMNSGGEYGYFETVAYPLTQQGIDAAYNRVLAKGGGVIRLLAGDYIGITGLPISSGISYVGVPPRWDGAIDFPESGGYFVGGTQIKLLPGAIGIAYNAEDRAVENSNFARDGLYGCRIYGICFDGGASGIKVGALNASGMYNCIVDEIYYSNCTNPWAIDIINSQYCRIGSITGRNTLATESGGIRFGQAVSNTTVLTGDHSFFGKIFIWFGSLNGRGIRLDAISANSQLNNLCGRAATWQVNGYTSAAITLATAACVSGSADIKVSGADLANWNIIQRGKPVYFSGTTPNWLEPGAPFFIVAKNDAAKTFQIALTPNAVSGIVINQTGTFPLRIGAFPSLEVMSSTGAGLVSKVTLPELNCEAVGSIIPIYLYRARMTEVNLSQQGFFKADWCEVYADDSTGVVKCQTPNMLGSSDYLRLRQRQSSITLEQSEVSVMTVTASTTLSTAHHKGTLLVNSASEVQITIPKMLQPGYKTRIVQKGAGQVTVVAPGMTLLSKGDLTKTSGINSVIMVERIGATDNLHFTNDDSIWMLSGDLGT